MSRLTRISILLTVFFGLEKAAGILRQVIIARQFGLGHELDAFNVANNVPDLLYAVISGGALAIAFIPVLTITLNQEGRRAAWDLFSRVANLFFLATAALALVVALLAGPLVRSGLGIAPGFTAQQQDTVVRLMRLDLIATLVFSLSGLVMAALQANQHFLFPALAPLLYNLGQIFGALVLAPAKGYVIAGMHLPAFGLGVYGLAYGVIIGACLHLLIQVPALLRYGFHWRPSLGLKDAGVRSVLRLMAPRVLTVLSVQIIFLVRDNLASRLATGDVTALTYGWMLQQLPETLIGTAIGTALLPSLAELAGKDDREAFQAVIDRAVKVLIAVNLPIAVIMAVGLGPLAGAIFGFGPQGTDHLMWATRGFLVGLVGHTLMEVAARSFYARRDAITPLIAAAVNLVCYIGLGALLYRPLGAAGISLTDSICFTAQAAALLIILGRKTAAPVHPWGVVPRAALAGLLGGLVSALVMAVPAANTHALYFGMASLALGALAALPFIWKELKLFIKL